MMGKFLYSNSVARWFIYNNPSLGSGYYDDNIKLNKLLYLSNLMSHYVLGVFLFCESFVYVQNEPVIESIYTAYRNNKFGKATQNVCIENISEEQLLILKIINFVYADKPINSLIEETPLFYSSLYKVYKDFDFSDVKKERINGNIFYYKSSNLTMSDKIISELHNLDKVEFPQFLSLVNGELVFS